MKKTALFLTGLGLMATLMACSISMLGTPTPLPTQVSSPSPTPLPASPTTTAPVPGTMTPAVSQPTVPPEVPTPSSIGVLPTAATGAYAVILVAADDVLNIRTGPGANYPIAGSFPPTATNIIRTGASTTVSGVPWVQVQNPSGGTGWVNATFLTEFESSATFCGDSRVNSLLTGFGNALKTSNGEQLAALVSPLHGLAVHLWRSSAPITFDREHARWVFDSTYIHNWGSAPASGMDSIGSFHERVLPNLLDVFNASVILTCNSLGSATQFDSQPWPYKYSNVNFYTVYKPGTPGVDLDFRYLLVGVEYVQGQPSLMAVIHFTWEP
jgi:hypothetical protein